ncbi:hypothetical protein O3G_MSEX002653 [Manduca sexta]|uniref:LIM domain kinase 1 n=1 Tax=Manduca sexta TaxID=7130 RepID=A0A922CEA7_MANSE|nr:hypothetical protein O3G_MSEX002653 [Manduca sexta]
MEGPNNKESLSCAGCLNDIGNEEYVCALGQDWHKDCFRCSVCDALLSSWYFEKAGLLFCQDDYWARFGESCQQCGQVITGPLMSAGEHRFHPECFACRACGAHVEDGEPYALLERSTLYCGACYGSESGRCRSHAIRVLDVPPGAVRVAADKGALAVAESRCAGKLSRLARALLRAVLSLCIQLTCNRIDSSCGLLTLHIGDRILEINGTPVRSRPLDEIQRALTRPDQLIQLTIEQNPDTTNKRAIPTARPEVEDKPKHETKSPVERKILKENVFKDKRDEDGRKERLFKRKGEDGGKARVIKRRQTPSSPLLGDKERSSSMSKLLDVVEGPEPAGVLRDLSRARSFRAEHAHAHGQKVFRAADLLQGELLGSGFFGEVYKVTHRDTNEVMVLKQLYRVDEEAQRNFLKEVAVLRSLKHPNVLRFVGVLYKDKRLHLVTEYVAGGTLHQLIQDRSASLSWGARARLARDVAAGLGYLHRMNVIHRDLNSHNCLVREDRTVIVADFGLARIVSRTASSAHHHAHTLRRKRYTVVGNPYWMAPEMMNGNVYDEKVDVFSFGIILCEIIGRVSADPDFLPRRSDFGLNESAFVEKFCRTSGCPEPFYKVAFLACNLDPDSRPPFEVIEIWLESLVMHLSNPGPVPPSLLADIVRYACGAMQRDHGTPDGCPAGDTNGFCGLTRTTSRRGSGDLLQDTGVIKSQSNATIWNSEVSSGRALGKCVSATALGGAPPPGLEPARSRSQHALHTPGYILRARGNTIDITKVDDITEWLEPPPPLKRTSPDAQLNKLDEQANKTRRVDDDDANLPPFLRNQSVEGLESKSKNEIDAPVTFCRHISIPDNCEVTDEGMDSDSTDEDLTDITCWYRNLSAYKKIDVETKNVFSGIVKKGESLLPKKDRYDVAEVMLRNPECMKNERKIPEADSRRYNIDYLTQNPMMAVCVKNLPKVVEKEKPTEKSNFFTKTLLSPKLSRLFKPNTAEVVRNKAETDDNKDEKSRSKFFIQRPASPSNIGRSYRVRPAEDERKPSRKADSDVIKSDLKLASMGKPMTPIFRRHIPTEKPEFADGRFSYRDKRTKYEKEPKFVDVGRNKIKAPEKTPLIRNSQGNTALQERKTENSDKVQKKREPGISRSNYVSLANLKINGKTKDLELNKSRQDMNENSPVERVM